jgi:hypothetical protein
MRAKTFHGRTDDRHRVVIPNANIIKLNKKFGRTLADWEDVIVELEIKSIFFRDHKHVKL